MDLLCRFDTPGFFDPPECDEVHISVTFTWDIPRAEYLHKAWMDVHPVVKIGGPAMGDPGCEFVPGRYLKHGEVITSRGCPNKCGYCMAQAREGVIREYPVADGYRVHDNNLLATSREHFASVIEMLKRQKESPIFSGGIEARRLTKWHAEMMRSCMPKTIYFANDRPGDIEHIKTAVKRCIDAGFTNNHMAAYVLAGYKNDTPERAEQRINATWDAGCLPYLMIYIGEDGRKPSREWLSFKSGWRKPEVTRARMKLRKGVENGSS